MALSEHPAYSTVASALVCPICPEDGTFFEAVDVAIFEEHFLAHAPGPELAKEFLDPKTYAALATKNGWLRNLARVIDQIRKLHRLSQSPNNHEAGLAAARAAELMLKYQLDVATIDADREAVPEVVEEHVMDRASKVVYWRASILGALAKTLGCELLFLTARGRDQNNKVVERSIEYRVIGSAGNAQAIRYMYKYFCAEIAILADRAYDARLETKVKIDSVRAYKNAHRSAAASVIGKRLLDERDRNRNQCMAASDGSTRRALARLNETEVAVQHYMEKLRGAGDIPDQRGQPSLSDRIGAFDGMEDGERVDLGAGKAGLTAGALRLRGRSDA